MALNWTRHCQSLQQQQLGRRRRQLGGPLQRVRQRGHSKLGRQRHFGRQQIQCYRQSAATATEAASTTATDR